MRYYISKRKMQHKMKELCETISHKIDKLILRKDQEDRTQFKIYIYIHGYWTIFCTNFDLRVFCLFVCFVLFFVFQ